MLKYLPVDKEAIPYKFQTKISEEIFEFEIHYNSVGDFFTVDLYSNGELLVAGEKIVYGRPLFNAYIKPGFPLAVILPLDLAEQETRVGWDNFMKTVFCFILTREDFENV